MKEKNRIRLEAAEHCARLLSDHLERDEDMKSALVCSSCARAVREWRLNGGVG